VTTTIIDVHPHVGLLLRDWRKRRNLSQIDLASQTNISPRHISFVETGRAKPSRELLLKLAEELQVPVRQRNTLLIAGGHAPAYEETEFNDPRRRMGREAVERFLKAHEPYPAFAIDADEDIIAMNRGAQALIADVDESLRTQPMNLMRLSLHPKGLSRQVINVEEWRAHLLGRLYRQAVHSCRQSLHDLYEEVVRYPAPEGGKCRELADSIVGSVQLVGLGAKLRLFTSVTRFGATTDITLSELSLETMHPADEATAELFHQVVGRQ
jgi:transcriptional regulator with XRE-family HTH domain